MSLPILLIFILSKLHVGTVAHIACDGRVEDEILDAVIGFIRLFTHRVCKAVDFIEVNDHVLLRSGREIVGLVCDSAQTVLYF